MAAVVKEGEERKQMRIRLEKCSDYNSHVAIRPDNIKKKIEA